MIKRVAIIGTGLIGASVGLALRRAGFAGEIVGLDRSHADAAQALAMGAVDRLLAPEVWSGDLPRAELWNFDVIVLCVPVLAVLDWMERLAPVLGPHQLVTDVGSTKLAITEAANRLFPDGGPQALFLPGHPMAGKESGGAALADASLFQDAMWLFTSSYEGRSRGEAEWREWVGKFGCRTMDLDAARHDQVCAWVSHLPQMVATAMSAMFADEFQHVPELAAEFEAIGGRALREMTRLGASPYSMWRDVAMTNTQPLAATLYALEQRLAHLRENLKTPELREEFRLANEFRKRR
jgi:prephenate dehydrogenase